MRKRAAVIILMGIFAAGALSGCRESDMLSDSSYSSEEEGTETSIQYDAAEAGYIQEITGDNDLVYGDLTDEELAGLVEAMQGSQLEADDSGEDLGDFSWMAGAYDADGSSVFLVAVYLDGSIQVFDDQAYVTYNVTGGELEEYLGELAETYGIGSTEDTEDIESEEAEYEDAGSGDVEDTEGTSELDEDVILYE